MKKFWKNKKQETLSKNQVDYIKETIIKKVSELYLKSDKDGFELRKIVEEIQNEKKNEWISKLFQFLGVMSIGACIFRLNDLPSRDLFYGFVVGTLSFCSGFHHYFLSKKFKTESENELVQFVKTKTNYQKDKDKLKENNDQNVCFDKIIVPKTEIDKIIKDACSDAFNDYAM